MENKIGEWFTVEFSGKDFRPNPPKVTHRDDLFGEVIVKDMSGMPEKSKPLEGKFCYKPFNYIDVSFDGRVWVCCPGWLPYSIGNLTKNTLEEIWNGEQAKLLRESMLDSSFRYCNQKLCPDIADDRLSDVPGIIPNNPMPTRVYLAMDESCNLSCPSCRIQKIQHNDGPMYEFRKKILDKTIEGVLGEPHNRVVNLHVTGSGDPFGSKIFREFLMEFDPTPWPNLNLGLVTNGVMLTETNWKRIKKWHNRIVDIRISFDAGTEKTYNITRRGGNWEQLLENCKFLNKEVKNHPFLRIHTDFVVQDLNYKEMTDYAKMVILKFPNFATANFSLVNDWGTWDKDTLERRCIWKTSHPEFSQFKRQLQSGILRHPKVNLGSVKWLM